MRGAERVGFLRDRAFDEVQGYYFGRPFPESEACEALRTEEVELGAATARGRG